MLGIKTYRVKRIEKKYAVELEKNGIDPEGTDLDCELKGRNNACCFQSRAKIVWKRYRETT